MIPGKVPSRVEGEEWETFLFWINRISSFTFVIQLG